MLGRPVSDGALSLLAAAEKDVVLYSISAEPSSAAHAYRPFFRVPERLFLDGCQRKPTLEGMSFVYECSRS